MNIKEFLETLYKTTTNNKYVLYSHPKELSTNYSKLLFDEFIILNKIPVYVIDINIFPEYNTIFLDEFNNLKNAIIVTNYKYKNKICQNCISISLSLTCS